ncbi:hypothetical protein Zmor_014703 [Zophobas morio]|uniref:Uncharacterized protein n=2 Tax=Zophobas morio TaxID=2755281 RepID=A0AA38MFU0_9CUCU|nr:hypothetical protein Zmor_014703 [Zophobas morio]
MGPKGCLLTELPSLTVLYIPEKLALELTSDCGLDGTKRIACKGDADREEILKQLTCAMPPDDFDDKSTKSPVLSNTLSNTLSDITSDETSSNSKTTKPWIWTSNTLGTDYGMPTRHRRETEDTLSPSSTKSTTDLSTSRSQNASKSTTVSINLNYDPITTSFTPEEDVTLDMILSSKSEGEIKTTELTDSTTQNINEQTEEQFEIVENILATTEKAFSSDVDSGEYPSAIGQGQLFSIIENGTMFDLIEVNETTTGNIKLPKEMIETAQLESDILKTSTDHTSDSLYTTVVYHKEPPSEANFVTNKSVKKVDNTHKKNIFKVKESKNVNQKINDKFVQLASINYTERNNHSKILSKEEDMFPVVADSLIKLNRTFRKELPPNEGINISDGQSISNLSSNNPISHNAHQHIEIKWQQEKNNNLLEMKLFVTTKRSDLGKTPQMMKENLELVNSTEDDNAIFHKIDSKIDFLNINNSAVENNNTETFIVPAPEKMKTLSKESNLTKEQFLPKSLLGEIQNKIDMVGGTSPSSESFEPEPQAQPRPNRQRQLTRPQRRSFYPYFFSRVLG